MFAADRSSAYTTAPHTASDRLSGWRAGRLACGCVAMPQSERGATRGHRTDGMTAHAHAHTPKGLMLPSTPSLPPARLHIVHPAASLVRLVVGI